MKKGSIHEPMCTAETGIKKSTVTTLASGLFGGVADKKKGNEKKRSSVREDNEKVSKVTSPTTSAKSKDTQGPNLNAPLTKDEIKKEDGSARKDEKEQDDEAYQHFSPATNDTKHKNFGLEQDFKIDNKKNSDKKRESSLEKKDMPFELPPLKSKLKNREPQEKRRDSPTYGLMDDKQIWRAKYIPNIPKSFYSHVLEISSIRGPIYDSKSQSPLNDKAAYVTQVDGKDFAQPALVNSASQNVPTTKEKNEKSKDNEITHQKLITLGFCLPTF